MGAISTSGTINRTLSWNAAEVGAAGGIAASIGGFQVPRKTRTPNAFATFSAGEALDLIDGLYRSATAKPGWNGHLRYLPARHLYRILAFDETHPFRWRLEHKLVQALVLDHFCPGSVPVTCGLSAYVAGLESASVETNIREHL